MNIGYSHKIPVLPLVLLWLAYALLGWYLAAHHIIWLVGAFVATIAIALVRRSIAWLESLVSFGSRTLVVVVSLSASIALVATWSVLLSLFLIPIATTLLADLELRFAGFKKIDSFWILTVLAGWGLTVGELIDILLLPSSRY
ncbi:hypothetical protein NOS3756_23760 [Nostoc sp. NIES-3756]|jgi:hypothetical protein|uniref:hypothetical protein n=1 Tax=Nostoc sp. NIES-3756 TaxID=1751286 RepID=UPI000720261F|nr:hypothetical protein [Nostoc sp. NIES-3756]BAT53416.1 hypothetical protein NOS3756_23760 [Nostoc sp. NIES-3756]BAY38849.1 hypothetical protein NIES2111_31980 [Nostoc sp. NIES-2111]